VRATGATGLSPRYVSRWMHTIRHVTTALTPPKHIRRDRRDGSLIYNPHRFPSSGESGPAQLPWKRLTWYGANLTEGWRSTRAM